MMYYDGSQSGVNLTIGKDLSVIGFDNREICAAFTPALSTMALPLRKMGTIAADYLIQKIEHPEPSHQDEYKIPCEILKRKSVRSPENRIFCSAPCSRCAE